MICCVAIILDEKNFLSEYVFGSKYHFIIKKACCRISYNRLF